jgi:hypothetical protein
MIGSAVDPLSGLSDDDREKVCARLLTSLLSSRWARSKDWPRVVVCSTPDGPDRVVTRAELAQDFRNAGDDVSAHEALARSVGPGCVLLWLVIDSEDEALAGLCVVDVRGGLR